MSYDLAVWDGSGPLGDDQAGSTCDELYERYLESDEVVVPPITRIEAYTEALIARYLDDIDRGVVWASPPVIDEVSGPIVYLLMPCGKARKCPSTPSAREHGLVCFDPQRECPWPSTACAQRADQRKMPAMRGRGRPWWSSHSG